jgi:K(+)-stimulated pyrophosphate-energized sodium pump
MNMVSLLTLGLVLKFNITKPNIAGTDLLTGIVVAVIAAAAIGWAIYQSKKESGDLVEEETK